MQRYASCRSHPGARSPRFFPTPVTRDPFAVAPWPRTLVGDGAGRWWDSPRDGMGPQEWRVAECCRLLQLQAAHSVRAPLTAPPARVERLHIPEHQRSDASGGRSWAVACCNIVGRAGAAGVEWLKMSHFGALWTNQIAPSTPARQSRRRERRMTEMATRGRVMPGPRSAWQTRGQGLRGSCLRRNDGPSPTCHAASCSVR